MRRQPTFVEQIMPSAIARVADRADPGFFRSRDVLREAASDTRLARLFAVTAVEYPELQLNVICGRFVRNALHRALQKDGRDGLRIYECRRDPAGGPRLWKRRLDLTADELEAVVDDTAELAGELTTKVQVYRATIVRLRALGADATWRDLDMEA